MKSARKGTHDLHHHSKICYHYNFKMHALILYLLLFLLLYHFLHYSLFHSFFFFIPAFFILLPSLPHALPFPFYLPCHIWVGLDWMVYLGKRWQAGWIRSTSPPAHLCYKRFCISWPETFRPVEKLSFWRRKENIPSHLTNSQSI